MSDKQKITLALSDDVAEIVRRAGKRQMGTFVDACVRIAEGKIQPEAAGKIQPEAAGVLERMEKLLREMAEKGRE